MPRLWELEYALRARRVVTFRLLLVPAEGRPYYHAEKFGARSVAVKAGQDIITRGEAKIVVVYRDLKPTQLLVYRPQTYVHLENIGATYD